MPTESPNAQTTYLGSVYLPSSGTPVGRFDFIVDSDNELGRAVEVGTPVAAETIEGPIVGTVVDISTIGRDQDPLRSDYGSRYDAETVSKADSVLLASVQVFWSPAIRSVRAGLVRAATPAEIAKATGADRFDWPVAAGVMPMLGGGYARVSYDGHSVVGPEAAHFLIGGLSGQAAKTSYAGVLLKSLMQAGSPSSDSVSALIFNVKGDDLLYLDEKPAPGYELDEEDLAIYAAMGIDPTPFNDVAVYAPGLPGGGAVRTSRPGTIALRWDLAMLWPYLGYLLDLYGDEKLSSFFAEFREMLLNNPVANRRIDTFTKLDAWFDQILEEAEDEGNTSHMAWRSHHVATVRRIRRMLGSLPSRCGGLLTLESSNKSTDDIPVKGWNHGQVIVVDIAGLHTDVQGLVIARTCERLLRSSEDGELGVDHLVVFADELNAFAPSVGAEMSSVRKILQRVATQGRYAGISLVGCAQKLSKIDDLIRDQAASRAIGITSDGELSSGIYGKIASGLSERLATLPRGQMALWHYSFRSAVVVRFPRPAWRTGKAKSGNRRKGPTDILGIGARSVERLTEGIPAEVVDHIVAAADHPELARERLAAARVPDMRQVALHEPNTVDPDDPFAIGD
jgi:hypothetical protein